MGVVRSGDRLYIVQDFGHALPNYSPAEFKDQIAATVAQARHQSRQPDLARRDLPWPMMPPAPWRKRTNSAPRPCINLRNDTPSSPTPACIPKPCPINASHVLASHNLRSFSVGACYARTNTYPTGVYWVVLSLD